ncbi:MAG: MGMT family protein [Elusimicrobiota bacterium]
MKQPKQSLIKKIKNSDHPEFYKKVWLECLKIKRRHLSTYSEIAIRIGHPKSARAVGNALGKNPFAPDVPCHRVIRKDGTVGGYSKGIAQKIKLLTKEKNWV